MPHPFRQLQYPTAPLEGALRGAPAAVQVADRWHLWSNFGKVTDSAVRRLRPGWIPPAPEPGPIRIPSAPDTTETARIRERHAAVHALGDRGVKVGRIAEELRLDRETAPKYLRAMTPEELIRGSVATRRTVLDDHAAFLARRWSEGCDSGEKLHRELAEHGVIVSERTVRRFLVRMRADTAPTAKPPMPKVREAATLVLTHPDALTEDDKTLAKALRDRCPELNTVARLAESFAEMLVNRTGKKNLETWVGNAEASGIPELATFATGLRKDWAAVLAGLTLPWNSGPVEEHVNRIIVEKADVRTGETRPPSQARPARPLKITKGISRNSLQSQSAVFADTPLWPRRTAVSADTANSPLW
jgi:transposase